MDTESKPKPAEVPIYKNMKIVLTQNMRKDEEYVNGMECRVLAYEDNATGGVLLVETNSGKKLSITKWTDVDKKFAVYFPIRIGYASTIHKAQGGEFKHVTVYMDCEKMPAAGYTALSRVSTSQDYLLGGIITREHFVPATYIHPAQYEG